MINGKRAREGEREEEPDVAEEWKHNAEEMKAWKLTDAKEKVEVAKPWSFSDTRRRGKTISGNNLCVKSAKGDTFPQCGTHFHFEQKQRTQKSSDPALIILPVHARHSAALTVKVAANYFYTFNATRADTFDWAWQLVATNLSKSVKNGGERSVRENSSPVGEWHNSKLTSLLHNSWYYITKCLWQ